MAPAVEGSHLARLARRRREPGRARAAAAPPPSEERCELCAAPLGGDHLHLLETASRTVRCACRACALLFDRRQAAEGRLLRIPDRRWRLEALDGADAAWGALGIPVDLAYLVVESPGDRVVAYYPAPAGTIGAEVEPATWAALVAANPHLDEMEPAVEALLVRDDPRARQHYLVPIADCFELVGVLRGSWEGFSGGSVVWPEVDAFFDRLAHRARPAPARAPGGGMP